MNYSTWDLRVKRKRFNSESEAKPDTGLGSESPLGWGGCTESTPDGKPSFQQDTVMGGAAYAPSMKPFTPDFQTNSGPSLFSTHIHLAEVALSLQKQGPITSLLHVTQRWFGFLLKDSTPHLSPPRRRQWSQSYAVLSCRSPSAKPRPSAEWTTLQ